MDSELEKLKEKGKVLYETDPLYKETCLKLHAGACLQNETFYLDPVTGLKVSTKLKHLARGHCCESGCRHCPYDFKGN